MNRTITALAIVAASLAVGAPAFAGGDLSDGGDTPPPTGPGVIKAPDAGREESTTCAGEDGCALLKKACDLVSGTYTEWDSRDHGHPHGICTWPWE